MADLATERERQLTTGKRAERTTVDSLLADTSTRPTPL